MCNHVFVWFLAVNDLDPHFNWLLLPGGRPHEQTEDHDFASCLNRNNLTHKQFLYIFVL